MEQASQEDLNLKLPDPLVEGTAESSNDERYELWSVRLLGHESLSLSHLDGTTWYIHLPECSAKELATTSTAIEASDGRIYAAQMQNSSSETDTVRLLLRCVQTDHNQLSGGNSDSSSNSNDSDDEGEESGDGTPTTTTTYYRPTTIPFSRHVNIIAHFGSMKHSTREVAPSVMDAPFSKDDPLRLSYSSVPQKKGLKRRWSPPGSNYQPIKAIERRRDRPASEAYAVSVEPKDNHAPEIHTNAKETIRFPHENGQHASIARITSHEKAVYDDDKAALKEARKATKKSAKKEAKKIAKKEAKKFAKKEAKKLAKENAKGASKHAETI